MEESPTIVLPNDELRRMALENKLEEYKERLEMKQTQNPYMHPELFVKINSRELYKHDILERLLKDGEVNTHEFSLELDNKYGFLETSFVSSAVVFAMFFVALNVGSTCEIVRRYKLVFSSFVSPPSFLLRKSIVSRLTFFIRIPDDFDKNFTALKT